MRRSKCIQLITEQHQQMVESLGRLKELQRDRAVWSAFLVEQRRLFIEGELHAKECGDPCEGTVVMLDQAGMPTRDRPPHRYQSRTRTAISTLEVPPTDTAEPSDDGRPAGPALKQVRKLRRAEVKPPARRRK